jgi:hypothetical protein
VSNNTVTGANRSGGGISITRGTLAITGSTIAGNSADRAGGGVYASGPSMTIAETTIRDNRVSNGRGGGISYEGTGSFAISGRPAARIPTTDAGAVSTPATGPSPGRGFLKMTGVSWHGREE